MKLLRVWNTLQNNGSIKSFVHCFKPINPKQFQTSKKIIFPWRSEVSSALNGPPFCTTKSINTQRHASSIIKFKYMLPNMLLYSS